MSQDMNAGAPTPPTHAAPANRRSTALAVCLIVGVGFAMLLPNLFNLALIDVDESRLAIMVRGMVHRGEWLAPQLDGKPYAQKPPLFFWLAASAESLGCPGPAAGRVVSVLAAIAAALLIWSMVRRLRDRRTALAAALMFLTTVGAFLAGRFYRMDMLLVCCITLSLWAFVRMEFGEAGRASGRWKWWALFYLGAALATMDKGPMGVALPAGVVFLHLALMGRWRDLRGLFHPAGLATYLVVAAPWFVVMHLHYPGFLREWLVTENLNRLAVPSHYAPAWFYLPVVAVGFLPWVGFLPLAIARSFPARLRAYRLNPGTSLLWTWALLVLVGFTLARTKAPEYVLPAWPALAALVACALMEIGDRRARSVHWVTGGVAWCIAAIAGMIVVVFLSPDYSPLDRSAVPLAPRIAGASVAAALLIVAAAFATVRALAAVLCGVMAAACCALALNVEPKIHDAMSYRALGLVAGANAGPEDLVCSEGRKYSFPYYAGRDEGGAIDGPANLYLIRDAVARGRHVWFAVAEDKAPGLLAPLENPDPALHVAPVKLHLIARQRHALLYSDLPIPADPSATR